MLAKNLVWRISASCNYCKKIKLNKAEVSSFCRQMNIDPAEFACLKAIILFKPGKNNLSTLITAALIYIRIIYANCKRNEATVGKTILPVGRMFGYKTQKVARRVRTAEHHFRERQDKGERS
jgi:hypothetical protein